MLNSILWILCLNTCLDRPLKDGLDWTAPPPSDDWSDRDQPQEHKALDLFDLDDQNE